MSKDLSVGAVDKDLVNSINSVDPCNIEELVVSRDSSAFPRDKDFVDISNLKVASCIESLIDS